MRAVAGKPFRNPTSRLCSCGGPWKVFLLPRTGRATLCFVFQLHVSNCTGIFRFLHESKVLRARFYSPSGHFLLPYLPVWYRLHEHNRKIEFYLRPF
ncbi:hypothetical protein HMPREF0294_2002 [Corynebacterium glucuronolyticum ATCC 51867]|nr:hypothetical protein HMPREF0294_2002 [Corynebacterium glucuronolyticum ATCC 51867]